MANGLKNAALGVSFVGNILQKFERDRWVKTANAWQAAAQDRAEQLRAKIRELGDTLQENHRLRADLATVEVELDATRTSLQAALGELSQRTKERDAARAELEGLRSGNRPEKGGLGPPTA